jgi:hypothetical protein
MFILKSQLHNDQINNEECLNFLFEPFTVRFKNKYSLNM